jgi:dihydroorotate dehydrogenase electron transfer subunit
MKIHYPSVSVERRDSLGNGLIKISFRSPELAARLRPGNFIHIRVTQQLDPLFRRAMSVHSADGELFTILFRIVGRGTELLALLKEGARVDILGPLGNSFNPPRDGETAVMVSGGTGLPPLHFLARSLIRDNGVDPETIRFLCGISSLGDLPLTFDVKSLGLDLLISSDDGSVGVRGLVTDLLAHKLQNADVSKMRVYSCGPEPMLRVVANMCVARGVRCQVSLERHMPCGVGTCLGCVVQSPTSDDGFRRVCIEGPVFEANEVRL